MQCSAVQCSSSASAAATKTTTATTTSSAPPTTYVCICAYDVLRRPLTDGTEPYFQRIDGYVLIWGIQAACSVPIPLLYCREAPALSKKSKRGRTCRARTPPVKNGALGGPGSNGAAGVKAKKKKKHFNIPVSPLAKEGNGRDKRKSFQEACYAIESVNEALAEDGEHFQEEDKSSSAVNGSQASDRLIECPKAECAKKFRDLEALKFHLSYAHNDLKAKYEAEVERKRKLKEEEEEEEKKKNEKTEAEKESTKKGDLEGENPTQQPGQEIMPEDDKNSLLEKEESKKCGDASKAHSFNGVVRSVSTDVGLNLVKQPPPQVSPSGRATAVVKPIQSTQQLHNIGASSTMNGSGKRAASPAYSDISDEESDVKPLAVIPPPRSATAATALGALSRPPPGPLPPPPGGISVKPEFSMAGTKDSPQLTAAVKPTTQTVGPPPPPTSFQHYLPSHLAAQFAFPPVRPTPGGGPHQSGASTAASMAAMAAALAGAAGVGGSAGRPPVPPDLFQQRAASASQALDLLHQHAAASQYLASSKLQELQERAINYPFGTPPGPRQPAAAASTTSSINSPLLYQPPQPPSAHRQPAPAHQSSLPPGFAVAPVTTAPNSSLSFSSRYRRN